MKKYPCPLCPKSFENTEEAVHHILLEHKGISSKQLNLATEALAVKKQLGDYDDTEQKGNGFECPLCFELFSDLSRLSEHGKKIHNAEFREEFLEKLKEMPEFNPNAPPICEKCKRKFMGLIVSSIDGKVMKVCFNCYEDHYGSNMLQRLTMGTPDEMVKKMKTPLK